MQKQQDKTVSIFLFAVKTVEMYQEISLCAYIHQMGKLNSCKPKS